MLKYLFLIPLSFLAVVTHAEAKTWEIEHSNPVLTAEFSSDNKMVITGDSNGESRLFKIENNQLVYLDGYKNKNQQITIARFSPSNEMVLIVKHLGSAELFKIVNSKLIYLDEISSSSWGFRSAQFSSDSKLLITTSNQNITKFHKIIDDKIIPSFDFKEEVLDAKISHDGKMIVTAETFKTKLYTVENEQLVLQDEIYDNSWGMHKVAFSPNGKMVFIGTNFTGEYSRTRFYKIEKNKLLYIDETRTGVKINSRLFSPSSERYLEARGNGDVRLYKTSNDRLKVLDEIQSNRGPFDLSINSAQFSADNKMAVIACYDGVAKVYRIENDRLVYLAEIKHSAEVWSANFSSDGRMIVTASDDGTARITQVSDL